jgi:hypothetical protein
MELERHPPERGALPVVVAGGCCTTCCCCCCCCAYVVGGLAGAAVASAVAANDGIGARDAVGRYWRLVGWSLLGVVVLALGGLLWPAFLLLALGLLTVGVPIFQAIAALVMFTNGYPGVRRAAIKVTLAWLVCTLFGWWVTVAMFKSFG